MNLLSYLLNVSGTNSYLVVKLPLLGFACLLANIGCKSRGSLIRYLQPHARKYWSPHNYKHLSLQTLLSCSAPQPSNHHLLKARATSPDIKFRRQKYPLTVKARPKEHTAPLQMLLLLLL